MSDSFDLSYYGDLERRTFEIVQISSDDVQQLFNIINASQNTAGKQTMLDIPPTNLWTHFSHGLDYASTPTGHTHMAKATQASQPHLPNWSSGADDHMHHTGVIADESILTYSDQPKMAEQTLRFLSSTPADTISNHLNHTELFNFTSFLAQTMHAPDVPAPTDLSQLSVPYAWWDPSQNAGSSADRIITLDGHGEIFFPQDVHSNTADENVQHNAHTPTISIAQPFHVDHWPLV